MQRQCAFAFFNNLLKTLASRRLKQNPAAAQACNLQQHRHFRYATGPTIPYNILGGLDYLCDPRLNKGLAFTLEERQMLSIQGLQPPRIKTQREQIDLNFYNLQRLDNPLQKYLFLSDLHDRNERLYFSLIRDHINELMPIVYTPTVGLACQKYGTVYKRPHGLFVTHNDKGHVEHILRNWPERHVEAICVTDGERILGLGDLGCNGMGIPIGKLALYTALGRVPPYKLLPVMLDVGTNNESFLKDPLYLGLRRKRVSGAEYDELVDEFMEAVVNVFGQSTLIQFEDFATPNAFRLLNKYADKYCVFNDDIQGTSAVGLAGFYSSGRVTGKKITEHTYLFAGGGGANVGIATLLARALMQEGLGCEEAYGKIFMTDVEGLITTSRKYPNDAYDNIAKDQKPMKDLLEIVTKIKPSVLVGATAAPGIFTPEILRKMAELNKRPVIFAMSNPTSKAECTAKQAYEHTDGRAVFCMGSPSEPVEYKGRKIHTGQANNAYVFPGVALGLIAGKCRHCNDEMFVLAAKEVGKVLDDEQIKTGSIFPPLSQINEVSFNIALKIIDYAYKHKLSMVYPEPEDKGAFLCKQLYQFEYKSISPETWKWPELPKLKLSKAQVKNKK